MLWFPTAIPKEPEMLEREVLALGKERAEKKIKIN